MATSQSNVPSGGKTATPIDYLAEATKMGGTAQPTQEAVAPEPKIDYLAEATKMGGTAQPATPQIDYLAEATKMGGTAETPAQPVATPTPTTPVDKTGFAPISLESQGLDAGSKASALRALVGDVHTTDPKVINTLYTQAEKNLESANAEGQKARNSGATPEQAADVFMKHLKAVASVQSGGTVQYPDSALKTAANAFTRGAMGIAGNITSIGALAAGAVGANETSRAALEQAQKFEDVSALYPASFGSVQDALAKGSDVESKLQNLATRAIEGTIDNAPSMLISMGGAGGAKLLAEQGLKAFLKQYGKTATESLLEKASKFGVATGAFATSTALESGSIYKDIYDKTGQMRPAVATSFGALAGVLDAIVPYNMVNSLGKKELVENLGKSIIKRYGVGALTNMTEESLTEFAQTFIEKGGVSFVDGSPVFTKANFNEALDAAFVGAFMGGGAHVVSQAVQDLSLKTQGLTREQAKAYYESEQKADEAKASALDKWKKSGLSPKQKEEAADKVKETAATQQQVPVEEALAPEVTAPAEVAPTQVAPEAQQQAELIKKYVAEGQTRDNALLLANQDIADAKAEEVKNAGRIDTGPTGISAPISGPTIAGGTTGGTEQPVGTTMAGVGSTAGATTTGTTVQPSTLSPTIAPLYTAMQESGKDFKNTVQVRKFLEKTVFGGDTALFEDTLKLAPNLVKDLFTEWKTPVQAAPEVTTPTEVVGETPTAPTVEAPQEATPTPTAEQPAPERIQPSEESASINSIQQELSQIVSPERLQSNPPVVVNDYADLPVSDEIKQQAIDGGVAAFVDPSTGTDYYIASQIPSNNVKGKILHEQGGHLGLTKLIGAERLNILANQVQEWANGSNGTLENQIAKEAVFLADQSGEEEGTDRYNQEVVAYFTEIAVNDYGIDPLQTQPAEKQKVAAWLKELWNGVLAALTKLNYNPESLTTADIVTIVKGAARIKTTKATAAGVEKAMPVKFTNKMAEDLRIAIGESKLVSEETAAEPKEEPISPKIQASARDLNNKLGFTNVGINKMFTEMFYDEIKKYGNDAGAILTFVNLKADKPNTPPKAVVTPRRLLATLPEKNFENAVDASMAIVRAWADPEGTAVDLSQRLTYEREKLTGQAQKLLGMSVTLGYDNLIQNVHSEAIQKAEVLISDALAKYSMAGNKAIVMAVDNEYLPITSEVGSEFVEAMVYGLEQGLPLKQAFELAYVNTALKERTPLIESRVGPTLTGWAKFSDAAEAYDLQIITSDTGSTPGSWCTGREARYGENYLNSSNMYVYLQNGESLIAALVDKKTEQPKEWFGIGAGQRILPQHLKIKNTLPTLDPTIDPSIKEAEKTNTYNAAEKILKEVAIGNKDALRQAITAIVTDANNWTTEGVVRTSLTYNHNEAIADITGVTQDIKSEISKVAETLISKQDRLSTKDIYPNLVNFASNGFVSIPFRAVDISNIPDIVLAPIDQLILDKDLNLHSAKDLLRIAKSGGTLDSEYPAHSLTFQTLKNALFDAEENSGVSASLSANTIDEALEPLRSWWLAQPNIDAKSRLDITSYISDSGNVPLRITADDAVGRKLSGTTSLYVDEAVRNIYKANDKHDWNIEESPNYVNYRVAKKNFSLNNMDNIINDLSTEIKAIAPRIQASKAKKVKVDKILEKIERSESAEEMGGLLGQLIESEDWEARKDVLSKLYKTGNDKAIRVVLPALTTSQITDWVGDKIPHLNQVAKLVARMSVMRSKMLANVADTVAPWVDFAKKHTSGAKLLGRLMHYTTLAEVDPTLHNTLAEALQDDDKIVALRALIVGTNNLKAKAAYTGQITSRTSRLTRAYEMWNKLGTIANGEAQTIYTKIKNHYATMFKLYRAILDERILKANIPGDINDASTPKGKLMAAIRLTYEDAKQVGVYFPLMRRGNFWTSVGSGANREFYMFESELSRNLFVSKRVRQLKKAGDTRTEEEMLEAGDIDQGNDLTKLRNLTVESSTMLKNIFEIIDTQKPTTTATSTQQAVLAAAQQREDLKDSIYQLYLLTMPEQSFRKQFVHRKGTTGFSGDALRNFVSSGYTAAGQLSRLKYGPEITDEMDAAHASLSGNPEKSKLEQFLNEVGVRVGLELAPNIEDAAANRIANGINQAAFFWKLTSPRAAIANMTAIPIFGLPVLASHYGVDKAAAAIGKYSMVWNHTTFVTPDGKYTPLSIGLSKHVQSNPILAAAFEEASEQGITEITRTYDLLAMAKAPSLTHQNATSRGIRAGINLAGILFHHSERLNREIMFMSSFELAYEKALANGMRGGVNGEAFNRAVDEAVKNTYDSMFNYTKFNRPRIMRSPSARVIFQFKLFPQQVTAYLVRNFWTMAKGSKLDPEARKVATTQLLGTLLMTGMFAGITGLPLYSTIVGTIQGIMAALRDKDDPIPIEERNLDLWFRNIFLPEMFGVKGAAIAAKGPISTLSNVDIASSTSLNNLWFRDVRYDASLSNELVDFLVNMAGPGFSMGMDMTRAIDDFKAGHFNEGVEKLLPAFAKGGFTQYIWGKEGIHTKNQQAPIYDADEVTKSMRLWKAFGFNPTELTLIQETNYPTAELVKQIQDEKKRILDRFDTEIVRGDDEALQKVLLDVSRFDSANPELAIMADTLVNSELKRAKIRAMADRGLIVPPKLMPKIYKFITASRPETDPKADQARFEALLKAEDKVPEEE